METIEIVLYNIRSIKRNHEILRLRSHISSSSSIFNYQLPISFPISIIYKTNFIFVLFYFYRALQSVPRRHTSFYNTTEIRVHELNKRLQQRTEVIFIFINCLSNRLCSNVIHSFIYYRIVITVGGTHSQLNFSKMMLR